MKYINFNNSNSKDKGLIINSIDLTPPKPKLILESVPFMNGDYDFSTVATGLQEFNNRLIKIKFSFKNLFANQDLLYSNYCNWLLGQAGKLQIDGINGTIDAKCVDLSKLNKSLFGGTFVATFSCYPFFKIGNFGDYIWDTFNFENGIAEINEFKNISSGNNFNIVNEYVNSIILIDSTVCITIELNNKKFNLVPGTNTLFGLILNNGINTLKILDGTGDIKINFIKEQI